MQKPKVILKNVYKEYSLLKSNKDKLKDFFFRNKESRSFFAVKNISFEVYSGETIGIIGINGSGKSTLSNLLGQVIPPTSGSIEIDGETSLIAISVGLNGQLSGMENIELKCMMHGMSKEETKKAMPEIIGFADIGTFIDQPVKNYSSGMKSRLGFAISVHTNPDVLVVDEALSVGDQTFYEKCMKKVNEFKAEGKTIFFISHSASQMSKISDRVMWIHYGEMKEFGDKDKVLNNYKDFIKWFNALTEKEKKKYKVDMFEQQMKDETMSLQKVKKEISQEEKKSYRSFQIQTILLTLFFTFMTFMMITGIPISSLLKPMIPHVSEEIEEKEEGNVTEVERSGFIQVDDAIFYADDQVKESVSSIPLFSHVYVIEQFDNQVYKIDKDGEIGFVKFTDVSLNFDTLKERVISIETFLPYVSEGFRESYHYYLSFIGDDVESAENKIFDMKKVSENDQIILEREDAQLKYFAEDNIIGSIELKLVQPFSKELEEDLLESSWHDRGKQKILVETKDYFYQVDIPNSNLRIIQKKIEE